MALRNEKLSCNEGELNANGTVDNVVSYQFLCTLYIKFPRTGCNNFNNGSLHTAIFLILQHAYLARWIILPLITSLLTKGPPPFSSDSFFATLKTTIVDLMQTENNRISWGSVIIYRSLNIHVLCKLASQRSCPDSVHVYIISMNTSYNVSVIFRNNCQEKIR